MMSTQSGTLKAVLTLIATAGLGQQRRPQPPITLAQDEKPAFPHAFMGFDVRRDGAPHGKAETVEYESKTVGTR